MPLISTSSLREKLSNSRLLFVFGVLFVASQLLIGYIISPLDSSKLIELQTTFSVTTFKQIVADWQSQDLLYLFYRHQIFDLFLHPIWYSVFLGSAMALSMNAAGVSAKYNSVLLLPFIAGLGDFLENSSHLLMLSEPSLILPFTVALSACFANTKWLLCGLSIVLIGYWWWKGRRK